MLQNQVFPMRINLHPLYSEKDSAPRLGILGWGSLSLVHFRLYLWILGPWDPHVEIASGIHRFILSVG